MLLAVIECFLQLLFPTLKLECLADVGKHDLDHSHLLTDLTAFLATTMVRHLMICTVWKIDK